MERNAPLIRRLQAGNAFKERRLSSAIGPDESKDFTSTNRESYVVERTNAAVTLRQTVDPNNRLAGIVCSQFFSFTPGLSKMLLGEGIRGSSGAEYQIGSVWYNYVKSKSAR